MFKRLSRKEVYKDKWLTLYQDKIEFPDGSFGTYAVANRKSGAVIVVVTTDQQVLLNKEYRYVIDDYSWEIPGGGIDEGETPSQAAIRELAEETGIKVTTVEQAGTFYPLHSFNTEQVTIFYTQVESTEVSTLASENSEHFTQSKYVSFPEALEMIDKGEIIDAMTANALQMVIRKLGQ